MITESILSDGIDSDDEILCPQGLELVERVKLIKNSNCRRICAKRGKKIPDKIIISKNYGFTDADNVLKTPALFSRHTVRLYFLRYFQSFDYCNSETEFYCTTFETGLDKKKVDPEDTEENLETDTLPVRLEVLYPCGQTNVLSQKPKILGNDTKKNFKCRNHNRRPWTLVGYEFRRSFQKENIKNINRDIKEGLEDFYFENNTEYADFNHKKEYSRKERSTEHTVAETNRKANQHLRDKKPRVKVFENKTNLDKNKKEGETEDRKNVVTHNVLQDEYLETVTTEGIVKNFSYDLFPKYNNSSPVCILLKKEETDPNALQKHYEEDYLECHCMPRRFVLSISKYINDLDLDGIGSAYKLLPILNKKTFSWLIFVHDPVNKLNSLSKEVYNVSLNANFKENMNDVRIEGLEENSDVSITEIIGETLKYLKTLPRESLIFERKSSTNVEVVNTFSLLKQMKNWTTCTYIPDNSFVIQSLTNLQPFLTLTNEKSGRSMPKEIQVCSICYRASNTTLALLSCYHFFCNVCWKCHIKTNVSLGCDKIRCPEYNCNETVNFGFIISFLNVRDILTFARMRHNLEIERNKLAKWCSNELCGRVLLVNKLEVNSASCTCGEKLCFLCAGKPHWPLPCVKYLEFVKRLIETRDKSITPHDFVLKFDSKYCRICFKILVRYDNCYDKSCSYEGDLCQRCSFLWHVVIPNNYLPQSTSTDSALTVTSVNEPLGHRNIFSDGRRTKWYKLAMKHRLQQHPFRLAKLQASSKLLANRLSHYILREEKKGHFVYLDFMTNGDTILRENDKVTHYMSQIVSMYKEVSNVIESCTFLLENDNDINGKSESLHRRAMILSACLKTIFDLIKDGAFLNPKVVLKSLKDTCSEIRRVMESIVKEF